MSTKIIIVISFLFMFLIALFFLIQSPYWFVTSIAIDDAFYYPVVAYNIAHGYGSTYDNLTQTNGYHPLWCWINIPLQYCAFNSNSMIISFKVMIVLTNILMVIVWWILLHKNSFSRIPIIFFSLLLNSSYFWSIKVFYSGMETTLIMFFIALTLLVLDMYLKTNKKFYLVFICLSTALAFLSRLDSIFFVIVVFCFLFVKDTSLFKRNTIITGLGFLLFVFPYLVWNKLNFENIIPVSGLRKSIIITNALKLNINKIAKFFREEWYRIDSNFSFGIILVLIVLLVSCIYFLKKYNLLSHICSDMIFQILIISSLFHFLYNFLFMSEISVNWYQYLIYVSIFYILGFSVNVLNKQKPNFSRALLVFLLFLNTTMIYLALSKYPREGRVALYDTAIYARNTFPKDVIFGMVDSGVFRIISERRTIGLNGLIGDRDLLKCVQKIEKAGYDYTELINKYKIEYIVNEIPVSLLVNKNIIPIYCSNEFESSTFGYNMGKSKFCILKSTDLKNLFKEE